ncbi:MAG: DUF1330 domain-containing protein [Flavobacteriaceae bacterium]|nr:DUF1330 domain-containing protein [Flavobacteriaceae bacterium]
MQLTQVNPTQDQMAKLKTYPKNTPLVMINIIKFKKITENGNETGKEAYARYFRKAKAFVAASNAKLIWKGVVATTVIGDTENEPDMVFLVEYPTVDHFLKMVADPAYQKISNDRTIALEYGGLLACQTLK